MSNTHPSLPSRCCIPVQTVTCLLVLQPSYPWDPCPCTHVLQKQKSPNFCKGGRKCRDGDLGVEVLSVAVVMLVVRGGGSWNSFLSARVDSIVCSVLLIRRSNQAVRSPNPTGPTRLCTHKLKRALSHVRKTTHSLLSLFFFFFSLSQIPTTAVPTHGK